MSAGEQINKMMKLECAADIARELEGFDIVEKFEILDWVRTSFCETIFDERELSAQAMPEACEQGKQVAYHADIDYERRKYTILIEVENIEGGDDKNNVNA